MPVASSRLSPPEGTTPTERVTSLRGKRDTGVPGNPGFGFLGWGEGPAPLQLRVSRDHTRFSCFRVGANPWTTVVERFFAFVILRVLRG